MSRHLPLKARGPTQCAAVAPVPKGLSVDLLLARLLVARHAPSASPRPLQKRREGARDGMSEAGVAAGGTRGDTALPVRSVSTARAAAAAAAPPPLAQHKATTPLRRAAPRHDRAKPEKTTHRFAPSTALLPARPEHPRARRSDARSEMDSAKVQYWGGREKTANTMFL